MVSHWIKFVFCFWTVVRNQVFPNCYGLVAKDLMEYGKFRMNTECCLSFAVDGYGGGGGAGGGGVLECPALEQMLAVRTPSLMASPSLHHVLLLVTCGRPLMIRVSVQWSWQSILSHIRTKLFLVFRHFLSFL